MKKILFMLTIFALCFTFIACGIDEETYNEYFTGNVFESDGRVLSFDGELCMTYTYTNGVGKTFKYTYSVNELEKDGENIILTVEQIAANNDSENIDKNEKLQVIYDIKNQTVKYYDNLYDLSN